MTDKEQIIIDGVDVSGCLFYQSNFEEDYYNVQIKHFCSIWHNSCESINNSNCYFKQLARKTQECEELKAYAQRQENQREAYYKEYLKLSQQCEALKSELELYKTWYRAKHGDIKNTLGRYHKALEEIEKVVSKNYYDDTWADISIKLDDILNIINKAKGEE